MSQSLDTVITRAQRSAVREPIERARTLPRTAFTGEDVRARMKAAAHRITRDPRFVRREGDVLHVSELFTWYATDLGGEPAYVVGKYNAEAAQGSPTVKVIPYDQALNGACP